MASSSDANVSVTLHYRDSRSSAVAKNVMVVALGVVINYINGSHLQETPDELRRSPPPPPPPLLQVFHLNPRYILFIHLVINDMIQLTTTVGLFLSSYVFYQINVSVCCLILTFAIFTTFNTPLNVAAMAVECYVAVCFPLRHAELCTARRTYVLIGCIWALSSISVLMDLSVAVATEPLSWFYSKSWCTREAVFRHPLSAKTREVSSAIFLVVVWVTIFYTYIQIIFAARAAKSRKSSSDATKARNTILLHSFQLLLCMLTYANYVITRSLLSWFPRYYLHVMFVCYCFIQILPRFISPIVYGLRDKTFKQHLKRYYQCTAEVRGLHDK